MDSNQFSREPLSLEEEGIDLAKIARTLLDYKRFILGMTGCGILLGGTIGLLSPNIYTATATILPIEASSDSLSAALSSIGALGGLASQAGLNVKGTASDRFVAILKSRSITERVVQKYRLLPVLFPERWDSAQAKWKTASFSFGSAPKEPGVQEAFRLIQGKMLKLSADPKTGIIQVSVDSRDPNMAASLANRFVDELDTFLQKNTLSSSKRNREFLQNQVDLVQGQLKELEGSMKSFQEQHKLVSLDAQTEAAVQEYAALKSQLTAKEMEYSIEKNSVSEEDLQLIGLKKEIEQLKQKIGTIEHGDSNGFVSFKDAPRLGMRFAQLKRDLLVKQKVFEVMTQQLELAKVDEAKETQAFQVIDRAIPPDKKSKPDRLMTILLSVIGSFLLGTFLALGHHRFRAPEQGNP